MVKTDTQKVARLLREYAQRTSLRGGNPYRGKAYATAADNLAALSQPLERLIAAGTLTEIPGIGDAIADIITKIHQSGSHPSLDKLRKEVPEGVLELFAVPGLRPDKILKLHQERASNTAVVTRNLLLTLFVIEFLLLGARFPFGLKLDKSTPIQDASVRPEQRGEDAIVPVTDDRP